MGILYDTVVHSIEHRVEEFIKHAKAKSYPQALDNANYTVELSHSDWIALREATIKTKFRTEEEFNQFIITEFRVHQ